MHQLFVSLVCAVLLALSSERQLIWHDEFDGNTLDANYWNIEVRNSYQTGNVQVHDGNLVITAEVGGLNYTSGRINTQNKVPVLYGRVESRIKFPLVRGLHPAFWLKSTLPEPYYGEIDIMEHVNLQTTVASTVWYNTNYNTNLTKVVNTTQFANVGDWHVYAVEWDEGAIRVSVDDKRYLYLDITNQTEYQNLHVDYFIVLNLIVGGSWAGAVNDTGLPAQMFVDYVRLYDNDGPTATTLNNPES